MAVLCSHLMAVASAAKSCLASYDLEAAAASFRNDGYAVLPNFADAAEVGAMRQAMEEMVRAWWRKERDRGDSAGAVFRTDENQTAAQAMSRYFFDSANRVHFFREVEDPARAIVASATADDSPPALNKVGHGLHLDASSPFGAYSRSARVADAARRVAGLRAPVLPQSMYIFKSAHVGGSVTSHQDGAFLYTRPQQTVVGFWLALHDAHEENGCLWARPGSHLEPLRRRFVRSSDTDGEVVMKFVNASATDDEAYLSAHLLGGERHGGADATTHTLESGEAARLWEGSWPPANVTADADSFAELRAHGFVPLPVRAGDLVIFPGTLDHLSLPNHSPHDRHTFQLHMVEGASAGTAWADENWLQYDPDGGSVSFARI